MVFPLDPSALPGVFLVLGLVIWTITVFVIGYKGDHVDRPNRVPQLYGYTVCLVALITALFTVPTLVDNLFTLSNPAQGSSQFGFGPRLGSFESYRASQREVARNAEAVAGQEASAEPEVSDAELRQRYDALRADQIASSLFDARRSLVRNGLLLALALGLFTSHWGWLRRRAEASAGTGV